MYTGRWGSMRGHSAWDLIFSGSTEHIHVNIERYRIISVYSSDRLQHGPVDEQGRVSQLKLFPGFHIDRVAEPSERNVASVARQAQSILDKRASNMPDVGVQMASNRLEKDH